jgi:hypothetical protein
MQACLSTHLTSVSDELKLNPHKRDAWVKKNIGMLCILASQVIKGLKERKWNKLNTYIGTLNN